MNANGLALVPCRERGWKMGLANMLAKENHGWWRTRRWWIQVLLRLVLLNLGAADDLRGGNFRNFLFVSGLVLPIAAIVLSQETILGERHSGTSAWMFFKTSEQAGLPAGQNNRLWSGFPGHRGPPPELDLSLVQFEQLAAAISESPWPELKDRQRVVDLIEKLNSDGVIPSEAGPKDMTRFAENLTSMIRASKKKVRLEDALSELDIRLRAFTEESFPRSASLLQVCMGMLCQGGMLTGPLQKYSCHVTEQLGQLFPEVRALTPLFKYDKKN